MHGSSPPGERDGLVRDVPCLLKWSGGKRSQARRIAALAPPHLRYFEPFLGGGALLYHFAKPGSVASDIYRPLVAFWELARDDPLVLAADYRRQWELLNQDPPAYFYVVRDRFNREHRPEDLNFLMRTCVNGIVRFSRRGEFNNSFHLSRRGMAPERFSAILLDWSERLQHVEFGCGDFRETTARASEGDFVYLDPPYAGNRQRYIGDLGAEALYSALDDLNRRRISWALSFDGRRADRSYETAVPAGLYRRKLNLASGYSAVAKVLNGLIEQVTESLYLNY